jgi:hypothetical protein
MLRDESSLAACLRSNDTGFDVTIPTSHPYFSSHIVRGKAVFPGVAYLDLALESVRAKFPSFHSQGFVDCIWMAPIIGEGDQVQFQIVLESFGSHIDFEVWTKLTRHAVGSVIGPSMGGTWTKAPNVMEQVASHPSRRFSRQETYQAFTGMGICYGDFFRRINYVDVYENMAVALLSAIDGGQLTFGNLLDCAFQAGVAISIGREQDSLMPFSLGSLTFHAAIDYRKAGTFLVATEKSTPFRTNMGLYNEEDQLLLSVIDLGVKPSRL